MSARPTREEFLARLSDVLRRGRDPEAARHIRLLELNLPSHLAYTREERIDAECVALSRRGDVPRVAKHLRGAGLATDLRAARARAEQLVTLAASLPEPAAAEPWELGTRDDGYDRYIGRFRSQFVRGLVTILESSGVSDAARLCDLVDLNICGRIRTDEDLVAQAVRKNLLLDAARLHDARTGVGLERAKKVVRALRQQYEADTTD